MATEPKKANNRIILIIGVLAAAIAFGGVLFILRSGSGPTRSVLVARADIQAGAVLTPDAVRVATLPADSTPTDALTDTAAVDGKVAAAPITANTPIVPALFQGSGVTAVPAAPAANAPSSAATSSSSNHLAIDKGQVAVAIPAVLPNADYASGELLSVGYYIQPGDHIDILIDPGQASGTPAGVRYSFQDVPVLRSGAGGGAATGSGSTAVPTVYVVELPRAQAEVLTAVLAHRGSAGVVKYVLRSSQDYGKPGAPNYEDSGPVGIPSKQDQTVGNDILSRTFPR